MKILVIGGAGRVGSEVVKELKRRGATVRALVRKEGASLPAGVEAALGDLLDPVSVQKALQGVDKLYLLNAVTPDELTQGLIAYDLAKTRGFIRRLLAPWAFRRLTSAISPRRPPSR